MNRAALTRRGFLRWSSIAGVALVVELRPGRALAGLEPDTPGFQAGAMLRIDRDGAITVVVARSEMGQGVRTALPLMIAEELEVDPAAIRLDQAEPSPRFQELRTSGTGSIVGAYLPLSRLGAAARETLIRAAADAWSVDAAECRAENARVLHDAGGRSASYAELVDAASRLRLPDGLPLKPKARRRVLGRDHLRCDGPEIVTGRARYAMDVALPDLKVAVVARCPVLGGRVARCDDAGARAIPGVRDVVAISTGIAVVADGAHAAFRGREALKIEWEGGAHATFDSAALDAQLERAAGEVGYVARNDGQDAAADRTIEATYDYATQAHAPLEPPCCVARVDGETCEIWVGTQAPNQAQAEVAERLGIDVDDVTIHVLLLGGGFGRKLANDFILESVEIARAARAPIRLLWDRADDLAHDFFYAPSRHRLAAGIVDGKVASWFHRIAAPSLIHFLTGERGDGYLELETATAWDLPYVIPRVRVEYREVDTHLRLGQWRGIQFVRNAFARESFLDEVAHALSRDPLQLRLELLGPKDPLRAVLSLAAEKSGWTTPLEKPRGRGIAAIAYGDGIQVAQVVEVRVEHGDVKVERVVCAVDCGMVIHPLGLRGQIESGIVFALTAALCGEITFDAGRVVQRNFVDYPLLKLRDMPAVEVHVVESEAHPLGMGEPPVPPLGPALCNAIFAASGVRLRRLPIDRSKLT